MWAQQYQNIIVLQIEVVLLVGVLGPLQDGKGACSTQIVHVVRPTDRRIGGVGRVVVVVVVAAAAATRLTRNVKAMGEICAQMLGLRAS